MEARTAGRLECSSQGDGSKEKDGKTLRCTRPAGLPRTRRPAAPGFSLPSTRRRQSHRRPLKRSIWRGGGKKNMAGGTAPLLLARLGDSCWKVRTAGASMVADGGMEARKKDGPPEERGGTSFPAARQTLIEGAGIIGTSYGPSARKTRRAARSREQTPDGPSTLVVYLHCRR
jgi:hypothetical protein